MTPEAARNAGYRKIAESIGSGFGSSARLIDAVESDFDDLHRPDVPHALRGVAAYWRELADEIDARAAALEAAR